MVGPSGGSLRYCDVLRRGVAVSRPSGALQSPIEIYLISIVAVAVVINRFICPALGCRQADIVWGESGAREAGED